MSQESKSRQLLQEALSHIDTLMKANTDTTSHLLERTKNGNREIEILFNSFRKQLNDRETLLRNIFHTEATNQLNKLKDEENSLKQYETGFNQAIERQNKIMIDPDIDYRETQLKLKLIATKAVSKLNFNLMRIQPVPLTCNIDTDTVNKFIASIGRLSGYNCGQVLDSPHSITGYAPKQISFIVKFAWTKKRIVLKNIPSKRQYEYTIQALKRKLLQKYTNKSLTEPFMLVKSDGQMIQTDSDIIRYLSDYKGDTTIQLSKCLFLIKVAYIHDENFIYAVNGAQCIVLNKNISFKQFRYEIMHKLNIFSKIEKYNELSFRIGYQPCEEDKDMIIINIHNFDTALPKKSNPLTEIIVLIGFMPKIPKIKLMRCNLLNQIEIELCHKRLLNDFTLEVKHSGIHMFTKSFTMTINELNANVRHKFRVMASNIFGKSKWSNWKLYKTPKELDVLVVHGYFRKYKGNIKLSNQITELCILFMCYHRLIPHSTPHASRTTIISMTLTYNDVRKRIVLKRYNQFDIKSLKQKCIERYVKQNLKEPFDLVTETGQRIENDNHIMLHLDDACHGDIRIIKTMCKEKITPIDMTPIGPSDEMPIVGGETLRSPKNYRQLISFITIFDGYKKRVVLKNNPKKKQYQYTMACLKQKCMIKFKQRGLTQPFVVQLNNGNRIEYDNDIINNLIGYKGTVEIVNNCNKIAFK